MNDTQPPSADQAYYFILKSLDSLSRSVAELQSSFTAMQVSLVSRADLKDLRDYCDRELKVVRDRGDTQDKEINALKVKSAVVTVIVAAVISWAVRKLGG